MIANEGHLIVDGLFSVGQETVSIFYYGFDSGVPCILKFSASEEVARAEVRFYDRIKLASPRECGDYFVNIEFVEFQHIVGTPLPRSHALKMQIYVHTLASIPHTKQLAPYFSVQMERIRLALDVIHQAEYAHCDVKPNNIFIDVSGTCYLGDYDAVKMIDSPVDRTTEIFLPIELSVLLQKESLRASVDLDYAMLTTTFYSLLSENRNWQIENIKQWCYAEVANYAIAASLLNCLVIVEKGSQFQKGANILESWKMQSQHQQSAIKTIQQSRNSPSSDQENSVPSMFSSM